MSKLYIMMGIPGSGKSTWCQHHMKDTDAYVSRDRIRFGWVNPNEPYFSKEKQVYQEFIDTIEKNLKTHNNVYADQTSLDSRARRKLITSLHIQPEEIHIIWLNTPVEVCLKYNALRKGIEKVPEQSIIQMFGRLEKPTWSEGVKYLHIIENGKETIIDLEAEANKEWIL